MHSHTLLVQDFTWTHVILVGLTREAVSQAGEQHDVARMQLRFDALSVQRPDPACVHIVNTSHHAAALAVHPVAIDRLQTCTMRTWLQAGRCWIPCCLAWQPKSACISSAQTAAPAAESSSPHLHRRAPPHAGAAAIVPAQHLRRERLRERCQRSNAAGGGWAPHPACFRLRKH